MVNPPDEWPRAMCDEIDQTIRRFAQAAEREIAGLRVTYPDVHLDWDAEPARSWIKSRLELRFFSRGQIQL